MDIGFLIRAFADMPEKVEGRVQHALKVYETIRKVSDGLICFLIPADKDCGETRGVLKVALQEEGAYNVRVHDFTGGPNTDVLNQGISILSGSMYTHAMVLSGKVAENLSEKNFQAIQESAGNGRLITHLVNDPAFVETAKEGRVLNTCTVWNIPTLMGVGKFSEEAAEGGGTEEIVPTIQLVRRYGPCIDILIPENIIPPVVSEEDEERYEKLRATKNPRQQQLLMRHGASLEELKEGIVSVRSI